jgi:hypothetical protein
VGDAKITKDCLPVVKSVIEPVRTEDRGASLMKMVAGNPNQYEGYGTTSSTFISNKFLKRGFQADDVACADNAALK